jgi:hypothetical protein
VLYCLSDPYKKLVFTPDDIASIVFKEGGKNGFAALPELVISLKSQSEPVAFHGEFASRAAEYLLAELRDIALVKGIGTNKSPFDETPRVLNTKPAV